MNDTMNILMVASENDAIEGCKVGGIGDVVRDAPPALARLNCNVNVVTPSHNCLSRALDPQYKMTIRFVFSRLEQEAQVYEVKGKSPQSNVTHFLIDHPQLQGNIYHIDPPGRAFEIDATKYAFFCMAVAEAIKQKAFGSVDCLHLHDWHAAFLLMLAKYYKGYESLAAIRIAFTIHNLSLQGRRPFQWGDSSLDAWYWNDREFEYDRNELADPNPDYAHCVNPMAAGIRHADSVHAVSPSYAAEILEPSDQPRYYGGEGLEKILLAAHQKGNLYGILNGCEYPEDRFIPKLRFRDLSEVLKAHILNWAWKQNAESLPHSYTQLTRLSFLNKPPGIILTSVSRVVDQKMYLMREPGSGGESALESILKSIGRQGIYILLGTGDPDYEMFLTKMSLRFDNFIFLNGYSDDCARALYARGDLFLMPSSYEPCGISQMLAMRDGQPCIVHNVGGLKDTVIHGVNGFTFDGHTKTEQVDNFVQSCLAAIKLRQDNPCKWQEICQTASQARFVWENSVKEYISKLYRSRTNKPHAKTSDLFG